MASKYRYKIVVLFYTILHIYMTMALFAINKNTACGYNNIIIMAAFSRKSCFATVVKFVNLIGVCS